MAQIKIRKGHSLKIAGVPENIIKENLTTTQVSMRPVEFRYTKPKLMVAEGDRVGRGTALFFDKTNPDFNWASPASGTVKKIKFGARRVIEKIVIEIDKHEDEYLGDSFTLEQLTALSADRIKTIISKANLWHLLRQRPFNRVVDPKDKPRDIFISVYNTAPLSPNLELILQGNKDYLQAGINVLNNLTNGKVNIGVPAKNFIEELNNLSNCETHQVSGPHPAGNVGIQIHHIAPLKPGDKIWTITIQHLIILGKLFLTGKFDPTIIVSIGGPGAKKPTHVKTRIGASIGSLIEGQIGDQEFRIISGDVLTGRRVEEDDFLGFYDTIISILPVDRSRPFLGWFQPGSSKRSYSLTNSFLAFKKQAFNFSTKQNGSQRAMVPIDAWENVLPMDILPNPLYRSILAGDIEEMEKLGIWECDEEDFALCSFACPSKIDVGAAIRQGLDLMWMEG